MKRNLRYNVRELSYYILIGVIYDGMLLGDRINDILDNYDINDADKSYIKRECTGVIENISAIDFYIKKFTSFNIKKISREIMTILRIGIYELLYMDRVPSYATINECVEITKKLSVSRYYNNQYRYVNAVLRKIAKEYNKDKVHDYSASEVAKRCYFRIYNDSEQSVLEELKKKNIKYHQYDGALRFMYSKVYSLNTYKEILELKSFKDGNILISDASSIFLTDKLTYYIRERERNLISKNEGSMSSIKILDTCASPGGKILNIIDLVRDDYNKLYAEARDIGKDKIHKICENINRLKVFELNTYVKDASVYDEIDKGKFDIVICDVPCTGLGVVGKKPDIKLHFNDEKLRSLVDLQKKILDVSSKYVKPSGILSYSTCTTTKEENEDIINDFLSNSISFNKIFEKRIELNDDNEADGFYMCFLEKL